MPKPTATAKEDELPDKPTIRIHVSKIPREVLERAYREISQARSNTQAEKSNKAVNG